MYVYVCSVCVCVFVCRGCVYMWLCVSVCVYECVCECLCVRVFRVRLYIAFLRVRECESVCMYV